MEQSDIDLLHTVPTYQVQALMKMRHVPVTSLQSSATASAPSSSSSASAPNTEEIATHLFASASISSALNGLDETDVLILRELVACGGRANSRDLALYLTSGGFLKAAKKSEFSVAQEAASVAFGASRRILRVRIMPTAFMMECSLYQRQYAIP